MPRATRLLPEQHLRTQNDFQTVRQVGRRHQCDAFTAWWLGSAKPDTGPRVDDSSTTISAPALAATSAGEQSTVSVQASAAKPECANAPLASQGTAAGSRQSKPLRRLGVVASRAAVGNAVQRNRAKRRLRALFRLHQQTLPPSGDLLLVARRLLNRLPWAVLETRFVAYASGLLRQSGPVCGPDASQNKPVERPLPHSARTP